MSRALATCIARIFQLPIAGTPKKQVLAWVVVTAPV
jgi:hypothetical protein